MGTSRSYANHTKMPRLFCNSNEDRSTAHFYTRDVVIDQPTLSAYALGCSILGGGGGGDTDIAVCFAAQALLTDGPVRVVTLDDLPDDGLVMPWCFVGAPTVFIEKLWNGDEGRRLVEDVEALTGRPVTALMTAEIGGQNGVLHLGWASRLGLPVVDADGMGRSFPLITQTKMHLLDVSATPIIVTDERANTLVLRTRTNEWAETLVRATVAAMGGRGATAMYLMTVAEARRAVIRGSVSRALRLGQAVQKAEHDRVTAIRAELGAIELISGRVVDVERRTSGAFVRGSVAIAELTAAPQMLRLEIQNENLVALRDGRVVASTPDVISVLDSQTAEAIGTERIRYGQRVSVIGFASDSVWRSERGLEVAGPRAFGYDFSYMPVEELHAAL